MKRFADIKLDDGSFKRTNVWEVKRGKIKNPEIWSNIKFYSTHKKIENKKILFFVNASPNSYFRYKSENDNPNKGKDETLTHELCKEIISEIKDLNFKIYNDYYKFKVIDSEIEHRIDTPNGTYVVDIFVKFEQSIPNYLKIKWNGILAIEIFVHHKCEQDKITNLKAAMVPVIQVRISDKLWIDESKELSLKDIENKKAFLTSYFEKEIFAQLLLDPSSEEYNEMIENSKLIQKINELELDNKKKAEIIQSEQNTINKLRSDNLSFSEKYNMLANEQNKFQSSIWYKFYKFFNKN